MPEETKTVPNGAGDELDAKLAQARQRAEARAVAEEHARKARELAILEAEERHATLGRPGHDYAVVDGGVEGPIVVKLGEAVLHKRFMAEQEKKGITPEACHLYVAPCIVEPDRDKFNAIVAKRPGLLFKCATALTKLFQAEDASEQEKP